MTRLMKGRGKIAMKKVENKMNLKVTFSKRRENVFKKASELCTLSGAEVAIIVFSPSGKVYSFGHPSCQYIVERFLSGLRYESGDQTAEDDDRDKRVRALNEKLDKVTEELEVEKKKEEELMREEKASQILHWWAKPVEELTMEEATALMEHLKKLKAKLNEEINRDVDEGFAYIRKLFEEP